MFGWKRGRGNKKSKGNGLRWGQDRKPKTTTSPIGKLKSTTCGLKERKWRCIDRGERARKKRHAAHKQPEEQNIKTCDSLHKKTNKTANAPTKRGVRNTAWKKETCKTQTVPLKMQYENRYEQKMVRHLNLNCLKKQTRNTWGSVGERWWGNVHKNPIGKISGGRKEGQDNQVHMAGKEDSDESASTQKTRKRPEKQRHTRSS